MFTEQNQYDPRWQACRDQMRRTTPAPEKKTPEPLPAGRFINEEWVPLF